MTQFMCQKKKGEKSNFREKGPVMSTWRDTIVIRSMIFSGNLMVTIIGNMRSKTHTTYYKKQSDGSPVLRDAMYSAASVEVTRSCQVFRIWKLKPHCLASCVVQFTHVQSGCKMIPNPNCHSNDRKKGRQSINPWATAVLRQL